MRAMRQGMSQRSHQPAVGWRPFERLAGRYDAWFDSPTGRRLFRVETRCLRGLLAGAPRPWLEAGVGTGRFAEALGVDEGVDPSRAVLRYAVRRGIKTRRGRAEDLPYADGRFGLVLLVVTICFLDHPGRALAECRRVLTRKGKLVVGLVPRDSLWGKSYACQGARGHPFYAAARFYTAKEVVALAGQAGFALDRAASCLFEQPGHPAPGNPRPRAGIVKNAGFVGLCFG